MERLINVHAIQQRHRVGGLPPSDEQLSAPVARGDNARQCGEESSKVGRDVGSWDEFDVTGAHRLEATCQARRPTLHFGLYHHLVQQRGIFPEPHSLLINLPRYQAKRVPYRFKPNERDLQGVGTGFQPGKHIDTITIGSSTGKAAQGISEYYIDAL